jgi:uncharacterized membrane protein
MREPVFGSDDGWRTAIIIEVVVLRAAIFELGILIAIIAVGASAARWWQGAPAAGAVLALIGAIIFYWYSAKDVKRLTEIHWKARRDAAN